MSQKRRDNNANTVINDSNMNIYFDQDNIKKLYKDIVNYSYKSGVTQKINEGYLDHLVNIMKQVFTRFVIEENNNLTLSEINNLTVRLCIEDIRLRFKIKQLKERYRSEGLNDKQIEENLGSIGISNKNINIEVLLSNLERKQTGSNLTFSLTEISQHVPEFGKMTKLPRNIGIIDETATLIQELQEDRPEVQATLDISDLDEDGNVVSSDTQVNAALLQAQQQTGIMGTQLGVPIPGQQQGASTGFGGSTLQTGDPKLTSEDYDEYLISIDSRNRDAARNKLPNEYRIDLKLNQQGQTRGLVQNLDQVRNVFEITLIDAILPNIKNASASTFDEMYILLDIPEVENPQIFTTSTAGTKTFGKLRFIFEKNDDIFTNVFTENCFKRYRPPQFLSSLPSITIRLLDFNGNLFDFGPDGYQVSGSTTATNPIGITTTENHGLSTGNKVYIYDFVMDPVQLLTFSSVPDAGLLDLTIDGELMSFNSAALAFGDTAAAFEAKLQAMDSLSTIQVSGTFGTGFTLLYTGADNTPNPRSLPTITTNTLFTGAVPVTVTPTQVVTSDVEAAVNSTSGNTVTVSGLNSFTLSIDASVGTGSGGRIINGLIQNTFSFMIRSRGNIGI